MWRHGPAPDEAPGRQRDRDGERCNGAPMGDVPRPCSHAAPPPSAPQAMLLDVSRHAARGHTYPIPSPISRQTLHGTVFQYRVLPSAS